MNIQIGDEPKEITDEDIYLYAMTKFAEAEEHNARVERERREKQRMYQLEHKNDNEISPVVIFMVVIIALIVCLF